MSEDKKKYDIKFTYEELVNNCQALICVHDRHGNLVFYNPAFQKALGYSRNELQKINFYELTAPSNSQEIDNYFQKIKGTKFAEGFLNIKISDGTSKMWYYKNKLVEKDNTEPFFVCYGQDVTERIEEEKILALAQNREKEALRFRQQFLSNLSHQIKTPLSTIIGFSDQLIKKNSPEEHFPDLENIHHAAQRLNSLMSDLLALSHSSQENLQVDIVEFNPKELVKSSITVHQYKARRKGLDFVIDMDKNLPKKLFGDPHRLNQIIMNLLSNAVKFTETGSISTKLSLLPRDDESIDLLIEIKDTGIGIENNDIKEVLEPFAKPGTHEIYDGSGLGLALVNQLVHALKGTIEIESHINKGTCFRVTIPLLTKFTKTPDLRTKNRSHLKSLSVLLCEDNEINQKFIQKLLEGYGIKVELVTNGKSAVEKSQQECFDLILMDIQLPIMDGIRACEEIRQFSTVPIFAISATDIHSEKAKCLKAGMDAYIPKPLDENILINSIIEIVLLSEKLNLEKLLHLADGDTEFIHVTLNTFARTSQKELRKMIQAFENDELNSMKKLAHKIKSGYALIGSEKAFEICDGLSVTKKISTDTKQKLFILSRLQKSVIYQIERYITSKP